MKSAISILTLGSCLTLAGCGSGAENTKQAAIDPPDLCIQNANIHQDNNEKIYGLTVKDGLIGTLNNTILDVPFCNSFQNSSTKIIDLNGANLYSGFVDSHAHLLGIGLREMRLNLEGTPSIKALAQTLADEVAKTPKGETIYGRGWIETHWPEDRFPSRQDLDAVSPDNPVILQRADGHAMVVNSAALKAAGITKDTKPPFGGDILHSKDGTPTGMLIDHAMGLVKDLMPTLTPARKEAAYIKASEVYAAYGWTGIQSMSVNPLDVPIIERLSDEGKLKIRVYNAVDVEGADDLIKSIAENGPHTSKNGRIVTRGLKLYIDGALGSRGAALLEPYDDDPKNTGLFLVKKETIMPIFEQSLRDGLQISTHAIGDRANQLMLDWYAEAFAAVPESERKIAKPRWRNEHSQILDLADIPRYKELGVIASMQPSHAIGDLYFAEKRIGKDRLAGGYAWRSLIDSGAIIAGGSDAPVERGDPRIEFYAAVARKSLDGYSDDNWFPNEKVTRPEALKMLTEWAAYAAFEEEFAGKITPGMRADFTVFDKDIMTIPEAEILAVETVMTIVDGEVVYRK
jgi:predicted amidohydrolase YtcJ